MNVEIGEGRLSLNLREAWRHRAEVGPVVQTHASGVRVGLTHACEVEVCCLCHDR